MTQLPQQHLADTLAAYQQAVETLFSFVTDPTGDRVFVEKSDETRRHEQREQLARTADFLEFAGNPQHHYRTVHIAGTSGKGSVAAMVAAVLTGSGWRTGFHVSPYLQLPTEKLAVNGQMISPGGFAQAVQRLMEIHAAWMQAGRDFNDLRYGEAWVALTYLWFAWEQVAWAVMETGLGGRFDPTNVVSSTLAMITNVNFDHLQSLGPGLLNIARHKAGIIKPNSLAITTETNPGVMAIFEREAIDKNARLYRLGREFDFSVVSADQNGSTLDVQGPFNNYENIWLPLPGAFQAKNTALAVAGLDVLAGHGEISLSAQGVATALANLKFSGRMEIMQDAPRVILDGAHNPHKIEALTHSLRAIYPAQPVTAIVGMMRVKDAESILAALTPLVDRFIFTAPVVFGKRSFSPQDLAAIARNIAPTVDIHIVESVKDSVEYALTLVQPDELLLVTGSIYLVGEARDYWFPRDELLQQLELKQTKVNYA